MTSKINSGAALAAVLVIGVTVVVGIVTWLDIRQAKSEFYAATELRGVVLAGSIAEIIADPVYEGDVDKIRDVAKIARHQEDLEAISVVAADGRLLADPLSNGPSIGHVNDEFVLTSLRDGTTVVMRDGATVHVVEPIEVGAQILGAVHITYGDESLGEYVSALTRQRLLIGTVLALASFAAALVASRIITSPLRNLTSHARMLANGRMDARVKPNGTSEFRELAQTFNEMASRLETSHAELTELSQAKTRFFTSVTHERKTPLTASASFTDLLSKDPEENLDERQKQFIEIIKRNNLQLLTLIDDLLDMGQVETGTIGLSLKLIDLNDAVATVIENMTPLAAARNQRLIFRKSEQALTVKADETRIEQVVTNLISNALKYSEDGAKVEISSHLEDQNALVSVEDSGNGIHPDELGKLFLPFHRSQDAVRNGIKGVGLGLYVVDRLVQLHGGKISVKSDLGIGSVFSVALPVNE